MRVGRQEYVYKMTAPTVGNYSEKNGQSYGVQYPTIRRDQHRRGVWVEGSSRRDLTTAS